MGQGSRILMFFALFRVFDRKIDYVHSCVTKKKLTVLRFCIYLLIIIRFFVT